MVKNGHLDWSDKVVMWWYLDRNDYREITFKAAVNSN